jgi:hypothetical protein
MMTIVMADDTMPILSSSSVRLGSSATDTLTQNMFIMNGDDSTESKANLPCVNFYCRSTTSSDGIEERVIYLDSPCKIGRSVAKIKPEVNNAIFDCKVLSRNHAVLWYEDEKVTTQDLDMAMIPYWCQLKLWDWSWLSKILRNVSKVFELEVLVDLTTNYLAP